MYRDDPVDGPSRMAVCTKISGPNQADTHAWRPSAYPRRVSPRQRRRIPGAVRFEQPGIAGATKVNMITRTGVHVDDGVRRPAQRAPALFRVTELLEAFSSVWTLHDDESVEATGPGTGSAWSGATPPSGGDNGLRGGGAERARAHETASGWDRGKCDPVTPIVISEGTPWSCAWKRTNAAAVTRNWAKRVLVRPKARACFSSLKRSHCRRAQYRGCRSTPAFGADSTAGYRAALAVVPHHFDNGAPGHRPGARLAASASRGLLGRGDDRPERRDRRLLPREDRVVPATTYSTPAASRWSKISRQPTRSRARGKARQSFGTRFSARQPSPPRCPGGRGEYCRASSSKVRLPRVASSPGSSIAARRGSRLR